MKKKLAVIAFIALASSNLYFLSEWQGAKSDRLYYDYAVPHLELNGVMLFYGVDMYQGKFLTNPNPGAVAYGKITGYVAFDDISKQPRGAWQYYTIEATDRYDESGNQIFTLIDTLKLSSIPPRSFDAEDLSVVSNTSQSVTLESESGQSFVINKKTRAVRIDDGDASTLITNQSDYKDFIFRLYK